MVTRITFRALLPMTGSILIHVGLVVGLSDTELNGYRDHADQIRRRAYGTVGYRLDGGTMLRFDLGFTASNERLPGALTKDELDRDPTRANPISVAARNVLGDRGAQTVDRINTASDYAVYAEEQLDLTPAVALVAGARGQYAVRGVRNRFGTDDADLVDFWSVSPKAGVVWRVGPDAQVYANASHAYEPPLLLELTAPGQVPGNLGDPDADRGIVVWEDSTAVRRRILLRFIVQDGRSLGPVRTLSQANKAWAPAVAVGPGGFLVAWHEEQFPAIKTVVLRVTAKEDGR